MNTAIISLEVVKRKFPDNVNDEVKIETELDSSVVCDEVHVKQEVEEEPAEHVAPGSLLGEGLCQNFTRYEVVGTLQSVYCDICWMCCKNADSLKEHQETQPGCKRDYTLQDESCEFHVQQISDGLRGSSQKDPTFNMKSFVRPMEETLAGKCHTCNICNKSFTRKNNLNKHKLIHEGRRPFTCDMCNQAFTHPSKLNRHKLIHTGERPFACDVCNKTFMQKPHLDRHKLIHTGERSFICDVCDLTFSQKFNLHRHKLKHTGDRIFNCDACNQAFTQKSHLNAHKRVHSGERPFACDVCKQTFTVKCNLNRHRDNMHNLKPISL